MILVDSVVCARQRGRASQSWESRLLHIVYAGLAFAAMYSTMQEDVRLHQLSFNIVAPSVMGQAETLQVYIHVLCMRVSQQYALGGRLLRTAMSKRSCLASKMHDCGSLF